MGLMKGRVTARRYRVIGEIPKGFRDVYTESLNDNAFKEPVSAIWSSPVQGWCLPDNMLDTDFTDRDRWLFGQYILLQHRRSEKKVNSRRLKALLGRRVASWCKDNSRERCPASVKAELRSTLIDEMMLRTMPSDQVAEVLWSFSEGALYVSTTAENVNDNIRTLFRNTFGLVMLPASPLDWLNDNQKLQAAVEITGLSDYRIR